MICHPSCDHPMSDSHGYCGVTCCICDGRPCLAVTVELMVLHRAFDIALWTEASHVAPF